MRPLELLVVPTKTGMFLYLSHMDAERSTVGFYWIDGWMNRWMGMDRWMGGWGWMDG
jgi:hypothetical protein